MAVQMMKHNGKMVPAEFKNGKWVPIKGGVLAVEGEKLVVKKEKKQKDETN